MFADIDDSKMASSLNVSFRSARILSRGLGTSLTSSTPLSANSVLFHLVDVVNKGDNILSANDTLSIEVGHHLRYIRVKVSFT